MSKKEKNSVVKQIEELVARKKSGLLADVILKLCEGSNLKGKYLIPLLVTDLTYVMYHTASVKEDYHFRSLTADIQKEILRGIRFLKEEED